MAAYGKAAAEGNDFVVGPLGRDEVSAVFREANLPVPVLALNRGTVAPPSGNASFSLSPEDDGIAAAEYLLSRERKRVLVINGSDDNGRRAAQRVPRALHRSAAARSSRRSAWPTHRAVFRANLASASQTAASMRCSSQ